MSGPPPKTSTSGTNSYGAPGEQQPGRVVITCARVDKAQPSINGRVYHDEHFNHGVLVAGAGNGVAANQGDLFVRRNNPPASPSSANAPRISGSGKDGAPATNDHLLFQFSTPQGNNNHGDTAVMMPVTFGSPMPKWPAGHQSSAFEAVAPKMSLILSPAEIYAEIAHHGVEKAKYPWYKIWALSILAGCYVGFSYTICLYVAGNLSFAPAVVKAKGVGVVNVGLFKLIYGLYGFPIGFTIIVVCGAELYTSMCAYIVASWWEGQAKLLTVVRLLLVTWFANFVGCAAMAGLMTASEIFEHYDYTMHAVFNDKISHPWGATLVKGIFANWLVVLAAWMANAAKDLSGKFIGVLLPISAFVALGFEHCIANQFLFVLGWCNGMQVNFGTVLWHNLIPATIGNFIGGALFVATPYAFIYGRTPKLLSAWWDQHMAPRLSWTMKPADHKASTSASASGKNHLPPV